MDPSVEYPNEPSNNQSPDRPGLLPIIGVVITIIVIVAIAGLVIHQRNDNSNSKNSNKTSSSQTASNTKPKTSSSKPAQTTPAPSSIASSGQSNSSNAQLTNTGPGNVLGIFLAVSLAGSFLHLIYKKYRLESRQTK